MYNFVRNIASTTSAKALLVFIAPVSTAWAQDHIVPPMVNIPAGSFMMGSDTNDREDERPMHSVDLPGFQMAKYPVTVAEFRKFALDTDFKPEAKCNDHLDENWMGPEAGSATWEQHRYLDSEYHPVTCVTWQDADAYAKWLSDKTGVQYRLPTEREWEFALKANTSSRYFWGDDPNWTHACLYGNFADHAGEYFASKQYGASYVGFIGHVNCNDGEAYNSIVGLYRPNPFGLYDMVGNVQQLLGQCYYDSYQARTAEEMNIDKCEYTSARGTVWHFTPGRITSRASVEKTWDSSALRGFRLATDGHSNQTDPSTTAFEVTLTQAQTDRLASRPELPAAPSSIQLVNTEGDRFKLSWQPNSESSVSGYDIYQSKTPYAHLLVGFWEPHYEKIGAVATTQHSMDVTLPDAGGSFRVVARTDRATSLPSEPAVFFEAKTSSIPGRVNMLDASALDNVLIRHLNATEDSPERHVLIKYTVPTKVVSSADFRVDVEKSAWYHLNYRGVSRREGEFFKLWRNNRPAGTISYDPEVDDKTSNRHRIFLEQGAYTLQLSVIREDFDMWHIDWLEFSEVED